MARHSGGYVVGEVVSMDTFLTKHYTGAYLF